MRVIGVDMGGRRGSERAGCWVDRPLPLTPCPLTLALSHGGERGFLLSTRHTRISVVPSPSMGEGQGEGEKGWTWGASRVNARWSFGR